MSPPIQVRSFEERRREVEALKAKLAADNAEALDYCAERQQEAEASGDELMVVQIHEEMQAITEAGRVTANSLDRFIRLLRLSEQS